jgi:hypothetical protein
VASSDAGDIIESDGDVLLHEDLGFALSNRHHAAHALLLGKPADEEGPQPRTRQALN